MFNRKNNFLVILFSLISLIGVAYPGHATVSGKLYFVHTDQAGTPRAMTDRQGTVVWTSITSPFGVTVVDEDPDNDGIMVENNIRAPGQYFDSETGLHYNYYRYYDPNSGRYLTSDPVGQVIGVQPTPTIPSVFTSSQRLLSTSGWASQSLNHVYAYVNNNPINYNDPLGLGPEICLIPGVGAACAGVGRLIVNGLTAALGACLILAENNDNCDELLVIDTNTCNAITRRRGAQAGAACHASASQRYAACLRGAPLPPLNTWNN